MTFSLESSAYPVEYANYQRNSFVAVEIKAGWKASWAQDFTIIDPEITVSPRAALTNGAVVLAKAADRLIAFGPTGTLKFSEAAKNPTPVVLGKEAMAYFNETGGLVYQDYRQVRLCAEEPVPGVDEWGRALLIRPTDKEVLGVVQNAGARGASEKMAYVFNFVRETLTAVWMHELPAVVEHALLTADEKVLVTISGGDVTCYDTESGGVRQEFKTGLADPWSASLDLDGRLVVLGRDEVTEGAKKFCRAFSLEGEQKWSLPMLAPTMSQPPACGEEGTVYLIDNTCLKCVKEGKVEWSTLPYLEDRPTVTVTAGNNLLVLNGAILYFFDPAGEKTFESIISKEGDSFGIPPAVAADGKIYVMSDRRLYCLEQ